MTSSIITEHFIKDHIILDKLLSKFCEEKTNEDINTTNTLNDLKNALEIHWREEEILFNTYSGQEIELIDKIRLILNQHRLMANLLDELYTGSCDEQKIQEIKKLFIEHRKLEDKYVYFRFDKILTDEQKQKVITDLHLYSKGSEFGTPSNLNIN